MLLLDFLAVLTVGSIVVHLAMRGGYSFELVWYGSVLAMFLLHPSELNSSKLRRATGGLQRRHLFSRFVAVLRLGPTSATGTTLGVDAYFLGFSVLHGNSMFHAETRRAGRKAG